MKEAERVPTGVDSLDVLLKGGLPRHTVNLVSGPPGSGRSLLCMQFVYYGVERHDEPGLYITLEENRTGVIWFTQALDMITP